MMKRWKNDERLTVGMTLLTVITIHIARDLATFFSPGDIQVDIWLTSLDLRSKRLQNILDPSIFLL